MIQPHHKQRRQPITNQPTRTRMSRNKEGRRKKWVTKIREFGSLLGVMVPVAIRVLILLLVLLGIGIVANAVGTTFHLIHAGFLANEVIERFWV